MAKNKDITNEKTKTILYGIGSLLLLISPLVWVVVPNLFSNALCNPGQTGTGCGYANIGINSYAFFVALVPFVLGIVTILIAVFKQSK